MKEHRGFYSTINISDFETSPQKSIYISSHHRNIHTLMIEVYKTKQKLVPSVMDSLLLTISEICKSFSRKERTVFLWSNNINLPCKPAIHFV